MFSFNMALPLFDGNLNKETSLAVYIPIKINSKNLSVKAVECYGHDGQVPPPLFLASMEEKIPEDLIRPAAQDEPAHKRVCGVDHQRRACWKTVLSSANRSRNSVSPTYETRLRPACGNSSRFFYSKGFSYGVVDLCRKSWRIHSLVWKELPL